MDFVVEREQVLLGPGVLRQAGAEPGVEGLFGGVIGGQAPGVLPPRLQVASEDLIGGDGPERVKGLTEIRHRLTTMVADLQDTLPASRKADDSTEAAVSAKQAVILGELRHALLKPEYEHPDRTVQDKVLAALQLQVKQRGLDSVDQQDARAKWGISDADWCGEFAYTKARSIGLDPTTASGAVSFHQHVDQLERVFTYQGEPTWVWNSASSTWQTLKDFHTGRGAPRKYWVLPAPEGSGGLVKPLAEDRTYKGWFTQFHLEDYYDAHGRFTPRPGDIVLKDNHGNVRPDHITTAISYDDAESHCARSAETRAATRAVSNSPRATTTWTRTLRPPWGRRRSASTRSAAGRSWTSRPTFTPTATSRAGRRGREGDSRARPRQLLGVHAELAAQAGGRRPAR
ncbi:hypothetical protein [Planotetraspora mira]|uniref:hypothetical protein n=1 Tax=Planotetraspora mira TaxID=58121 RepID=UPI00366ABCED